MSIDEKDYETKAPANGLQSYSGPADGSAPANPHSNEENGVSSAGHEVRINGVPVASDGQVQRTLKERHLSMIALGGAIGTGLFIGSGGALSTGGPVGAWLAYIIMATMVYSMMVALGEMAALYPVAGAFTHYCARFVDPALGFATGLNYWYSWAITIPVEVVATSIIITYWDTATHPAVYMSVFLVLILAVNFLGARTFGEMEFWFSSLKVIAIVGLIILGVILMAGGGPDHEPIGFRYWRNPGPFNQISIEGGDASIAGTVGQFLAWFACLIQAAFSFLGTEIIATTLGEAQNPRKAVPKAIKRVFFRLMVFYVLGIFIIGVLVAYDDPRLLNDSETAAASPFVIAISNAGISTLPSIVNAVILISAWSAGNADLYAASRTMYALALEGQLPKVFRRCTKRGLPICCVAVTALFGPLAYMNVGTATATDVFNWLYNISTVAGILTWWSILLSYLRFYHGLAKQGISRDSFPYKAPFQPYLSYFGFISFTVVLIFNGFTVFLRGNWDTSSFFASYIGLPVFAICYVGWKIAKRTKLVPLAEIDYTSGMRELDAMQAEDEEKYRPDTKWKKFLSILF